MSTRKPVTKPVVVGLIIHHRGEIPTMAFEELHRLQDGKSALVYVRRHQVTPSTPVKSELREYRRVDGDLYYSVWERSNHRA